MMEKSLGGTEYAALLLNSIVDSTDDAIISNDLNGTITTWNKSAERLFGYTEAEAVGAQITILVPSDRVDEIPHILARIKNGERIACETIRLNKNGTCIDASLTVSPVRDPQGGIVGASNIARDTTQIKRAERANRLLSLIVDSSDDAIISKDLNGTITSWNKSAERLFGYTEAEAVGQPVTILIPPDRLDEEPEILARIRNGERVDHFETVRRRKDGTILEISLTISPIKDQAGTVVGASKIARDITERKKADAEIRRANRDLEQFAFSASHDLQEPLRTIKMFSELLTRRYSHKLDGEALEFLGYLHSGAMRMEALVRDLIAFTRVSKLEVLPETNDANEALAQALEGLKGAIEESRARVTADPLPSVFMHGPHLQQVFQNLVGNAIKYRSPLRAPVVHISAEKKNGCIVFSVSDNGIGIDPQYTDTIFGLFKRLHTSDEYSGTGMGLAICQRIVEQYHGRIRVRSEAGNGSVFQFDVPS